MNAFPIAIPANCAAFEDGMTLRDADYIVEIIDVDECGE